jgi:hypothetical protein
MGVNRSRLTTSTSSWRFLESSSFRTDRRIPGDDALGKVWQSRRASEERANRKDLRLRVALFQLRIVGNQHPRSTNLGLMVGSVMQLVRLVQGYRLSPLSC